MRVVRPVVRLFVCAATAVVITFIHPAAYATTQPGFSTEPRVVERSPVGSPRGSA